MNFREKLWRNEIKKIKLLRDKFFKNILKTCIIKFYKAQVIEFKEDPQSGGATFVDRTPCCWTSVTPEFTYRVNAVPAEILGDFWEILKLLLKSVWVCKELVITKAILKRKTNLENIPDCKNSCNRAAVVTSSRNMEQILSLEVTPHRHLLCWFSTRCQGRKTNPFKPVVLGL